MGIRACAIAALIAASAAPAWAANSWGPEVAADGGHGGFPSSVELTVDVTAKVGAACGFAQAPSGSYDLGDLTLAFEQQVPFEVACSVPFRVGVESAKGALGASGVSPVPGYTDKIPYEVQLSIAANSGGPVTGSCQASGLSGAGACGFKGPASLTQGLSVAQPSLGQSGTFLKVRSVGGTPFVGPAIPLAANNYSDTLTVTISPAS